MLTTENRLIRIRENSFIEHSCAGMLQRRGKTLERIQTGGVRSVEEYLTVKHKVERRGYEKDLPPDGENNGPKFSPSEGSVLLEFFKEEMDDPQCQNELDSDTENSTPQCSPPIAAEFIKIKEPPNKKGIYFWKGGTGEDAESAELQVQKRRRVYSVFHPWYPDKKVMKRSDSDQQVKKGRKRKRVARLQVGSKEGQTMVGELRGERARRRALETEEEKNLRREKDRLAKAAKRAAEPLEKRLMRREKDRISKALSRAAETEEQRRTRREKNRIAMAALRAAQTEEERLIRREKDRIKKAMMRAFETEDQKRARREKNRIAMSIKRASLIPQASRRGRNYLWMAKAASWTCLPKENQAFMIREANLAPDCEADPLECPRERSKVKMKHLDAFGRDPGAEEDSEWYKIMEAGALEKDFLI